MRVQGRIEKIWGGSGKRHPGDDACPSKKSTIVIIVEVLNYKGAKRGWKMKYGGTITKNNERRQGNVVTTKQTMSPLSAGSICYTKVWLLYHGDSYFVIKLDSKGWGSRFRRCPNTEFTFLSHSERRNLIIFKYFFYIESSPPISRPH
jgi:hypothetical protein